MCIWLDWHEIKQLKLNQDDKNSPDQTQNSTYTLLLSKHDVQIFIVRRKNEGHGKIYTLLGHGKILTEFKSKTSLLYFGVKLSCVCLMFAYRKKSNALW